MRLKVERLQSALLTHVTAYRQVRLRINPRRQVEPDREREAELWWYKLKPKQDQAITEIGSSLGFLSCVRKKKKKMEKEKESLFSIKTL